MVLKGASPRWAFMRRFDIPSKVDPNTVYLSRLRIIETPLFGIYLHRINEADFDRDPHDHPWTFYSFVLQGSYMEKVYPTLTHYTSHKPDLKYWRRFSLHRMGRNSAHQIIKASPGLRTLIFRGRRKGDWGFWTPTGLVNFRNYV